MSLNLGLLPNFGSATVLCLTFLYLWRVSEERYLLIWFLASVFLVGRYSYSILQPQLWPDPPIWVIPVMALIRGTLFVWGGSEMVGRKIPRIWWPAVAMSFAWMFGHPESIPVELTVFPAIAVFTSSLLWVAFQIGGYAGFPAFERAVAAWPMAAYGLIQAAFPWSGSTLQALTPSAYLLSSIFQLAFILGLIMVYLRSAEHEVSDGHARLNRALSRALAGHVEVCGGCKSVRGPEGGWERVERYVENRSGTAFSHGICPTCVETHYESAAGLA